MRYFFYIVLVLLVVSCNATKKVPSGSYLLNKVKINTDTRSVSESDLKPYLRQRPNSSMLFFFGKFAASIYKQRFNMAKPPISQVRRTSVLYIAIILPVCHRTNGLLNNKGYLNAEN